MSMAFWTDGLCRWPGAGRPHIVGALTALLSAVGVAQGPPMASSPPPPPGEEDLSATVYRDDHGVPHIVATNEEAAWYALGYEQARDALLFVQYACKAAKGELTWARGYLGLTSDVGVKVFNAYGRLAAMSVTQRRALFASTNPNIQANFYDNCVAFAAGADASRLEVKNAPATTPPTPPTAEQKLRDWLDRPWPNGPVASNFLIGQGNFQR